METHFFTLVLILLSFVLFGEIYYLKFDNFSQDYTGPETNVKSVESASKDPTVLSNGSVQKYKEGDIYSYELFFNLPAIGSSFQTTDLDMPFNQTMKQEQYVVKMGKSESDLTEVGVLTRRQDGNHVLQLESTSDYTKVCVYIGNTLVNCVDF
jgi:hypothetical protein